MACMWPRVPVLNRWGAPDAQGNDASNDFFLALAKVNQDVAAGEYYRCAQPTHECSLVC